MALSGSFTGSTSNQYIIPKIVWSATQSQSGNYSTVTATLYYSRTNSSLTEGNGTYTLTISDHDTGQVLDSKSESKRITITYNSNTLAITNTVTVPHNDNGTKTIRIHADGSIPGSTFTSTDINAAIALDTIPRKSTLSAGNGTLGAAQTLTVTKKVTSFTHSITYSCGTASGTVCTKSSATSVSFTPPLTLASQNVTGTSVSVKLTIETFNGSASIGTETKTITCAIPASVVPTVNINASDAKGYAGTFGGYIQGQSQARIALSVTLAYGSAIQSKQITFDGKTYANAEFTSSTIANAGTLPIRASVTDGRGRTGTREVAINVLAYASSSVNDQISQLI